MNVCVVVLSLSFFAGCSDNNSSKNVDFRNENTAVPNKNADVRNKNISVNDESSKTLDCAEQNGYSVVEVRAQGANKVNIVQSNKVLKTINLPTGIERNGFGFNWAKKTKEGFEISIEYGSRYYYEKQFNFICKEGNFYLYNVIVKSFDKHNPESMNKWDKKEIKIKPNLPIEKFLITDYMVD